jgi:predicted RNA binding protein YcfA (HicA-like mRNA interferase family)
VKLPTDLSGQELVKVLLRVGFVVNRQRGSHIILRRGDPYARVVVPDHKRVRPGTLRQILNESGVTVEELLRLR